MPKMSISGQIVSEIVAQLCLQNSIQTLLNFFGSTQEKIRRVCMELSEYNWATISEPGCYYACHMYVASNCLDFQECTECSLIIVTHNLIRLVLTICHVKLMQSAAMEKSV